MYFFNILSNTWIQIFPETLPSARANSCISFWFPNLYLYGGENSNGPLSDLWRYSLKTQNFEQILGTGTWPPVMSNMICSIDAMEIFYVFSGQKSDYSPIGTIFGFNTLDMKWELFYSNDEKGTQFSNSAAILMSNSLAQVGGNRINTIYSSVQIFFYQNVTSEIIGELPTPVASHTISHAGKSIYIFGGVNSISHLAVPNIGTSNLYKITYSGLECGLGYYGKDCEMCGPGFYNDKFEADFCKACPAGTFNPSYASSFISQCIPCQVGTYADKSGSISCKDCSSSFYCPAGTSVPKQKKSTIDLNIQPGAYDQKNSESNNMILVFVYTITGISIIIILAFLFTMKSQVFTKVDIFKDLHQRKYDQNPFPTSLGGLFSLLFLCVMLIFIISPIVMYSNSNIIESKTLVPSISYEDIKIVASYFNVTIVLNNFKGTCGTAGTCSSTIGYISSGNYQGKDTPHCYKEDDTCRIQLISEDVTISTFTALNITIIEELIYTTQIDMTISVTSSIPNAASVITLSLSATDSKVFNGFSPSVFKYFLIPSVIFNQIFFSDSGVWDSQSTGYHIMQTQLATAGSMISLEK